MPSRSGDTASFARTNRHRRNPCRTTPRACPSYWVVDPDALAVTVWELVDGRYVECAQVVGEDEQTVSAPYPATVVPARLLR